MSERSTGLESVLSRVPRWFWVTAVALTIIAIYSVTIGRAGLWDPWETHYGEVARNIVARGDPMDLWWRPGHGPDGKKEQVFASKHALPFWGMALGLEAFGLGAGPPDEMVRSPWPELALRLPSMIIGLSAMAFLGWVVSKLVNFRAALLSVLVMATLPQLAIVTRQAVTDIYFIAPVCLAMGAWAMAYLGDDRNLVTRGTGWTQVPFDRLHLAFVLFFALAAIVPLAVLHQHVLDADTVERVSRFSKRKSLPGVDDLQTIALHLIVYWIAIVCILVRSLRWRKASDAWMGFVYVAGGLALMGKGLIGPGIIGALVLAHMLVTRRLHLLTRCGLLTGIVIFVVTCFPWHHAMALFRGERWVNELIVTNNLARFTTGEQEQAVGGFTFYLRTLGIAALPWSAVAIPVLWDGLASFRREPDAAKPEVEQDQIRHGLEMHRLATLWFVVSFALITYSVTKYYHYLAPCLPPLGVMTGIWLDRMMAREPGALLSLRSRFVAFVLGFAVLSLVIWQAMHEPAWIAHLTTYLYTGMWKNGAPEVTRLAYAAIPFALGLLLWLARKPRVSAAAMVLSGLLTTTYVIDDYIPAVSESWSQRSAMTVYYDNRDPKRDRLLSWWFYYRGETFYSKGKLWVLVDPDRSALSDYIDQQREKGATLWVITTVSHAKRAKSHFPGDLRDGIETVYANFHYEMLRIPVPADGIERPKPKKGTAKKK